jgi:hypothetical protein
LLAKRRFPEFVDEWPPPLVDGWLFTLGGGSFRTGLAGAGVEQSQTVVSEGHIANAVDTRMPEDAVDELAALRHELGMGRPGPSPASLLYCDEELGAVEGTAFHRTTDASFGHDALFFH